MSDTPVRVLLTGGSGQLGTELRKLRDYIAPSHTDMDLLDPDQLAAVLAEVDPDVILHAAAYTDTRSPDISPAEAVECWRVNVLGTRNLVAAAKSPIVFVSTESAIHPYNFYILTKLAAELEVQRHEHGYTILRTSFRHDPFEYDRAFVDMWTIGDYVRTIAPLVDAWVDREPTNDIRYVGTGAKVMYSLAKKTRPDVRPARRAEVAPHVPPMTELLHV